VGTGGGEARERDVEVEQRREERERLG
jgi:hypothetical protein